MFQNFLFKRLHCIILLLSMVINLSCKKTASKEIKDASETEKAKVDQIPVLPFVGRRQFETRPQIAGRSVPTWFVEIMKNGDVYFSYVHCMNNEGWQDYDYGTYYETYFAGTFKKYMRCYFEPADAGLRFYEITTDRIYEVDEQNQRISGEQCCSIADKTQEAPCPCTGILTEPYRPNPLAIELYKTPNVAYLYH